MPDIETDLAEIRRLLAEAYEHYFANSDGHCKSSEGAITVNYPPFFWREDYADEPPSIGIYSYVLGPHRSHYFDTSADALAAVRKWHADEMAFDHQAAEEEMAAAFAALDSEGDQ